MPKCDIDLTWPIEYDIRPVYTPKSLVLLLHGFQQRGATIFKHLVTYMPQDAVVLAPNALFPTPLNIRGEMREGFAWYMFDDQKQRYIIDMSMAIQYLSALVEKLGFNHLPKIIIGYSMGGYLAPHVGLALGGCRQVIGINARFRVEALPVRLPYTIDAINGQADTIVDPQRAMRCHEAIIRKGNQGRFCLVPKAGHGISREMRDEVKALITQRSAPDS